MVRPSPPAGRPTGLGVYLAPSTGHLRKIIQGSRPDAALPATGARAPPPTDQIAAPPPHPTARTEPLSGLQAMQEGCCWSSCSRTATAGPALSKACSDDDDDDPFLWEPLPAPNADMSNTCTESSQAAAARDLWGCHASGTMELGPAGDGADFGTPSPKQCASVFILGQRLAAWKVKVWQHNKRETHD